MSCAARTTHLLISRSRCNNNNDDIKIRAHNNGNAWLVGSDPDRSLAACGRTDGRPREVPLAALSFAARHAIRAVCALVLVLVARRPPPRPDMLWDALLAAAVSGRSSSPLTTHPHSPFYLLQVRGAELRGGRPGPAATLPAQRKCLISGADRRMTFLFLFVFRM